MEFRLDPIIKKVISIALDITFSSEIFLDILGLNDQIVLTLTGFDENTGNSMWLA